MPIKVVIVIMLRYTTNMGKYEAKIPEIREKIVKGINPEKIILFGSYAWGKPTKDSDVDLFIVKDSEERRIDRAREVRKVILGSGVAVDILVYTPKEVEKRVSMEDPFIMNILNKGKLLYSV